MSTKGTLRRCDMHLGVFALAGSRRFGKHMGMPVFWAQFVTSWGPVGSRLEGPGGGGGMVAKVTTGAPRFVTTPIWVRAGLPACRQ